jgi:hypothetical protein
VRVLVDATFPESLRRAPNSSGVEVDRVSEAYSDEQLLSHAAASGYSALVLLDQEMVSRDSFRSLARESGITLVCSVTDDPFEAEANLRQAFPMLAKHLASPDAQLLWLRKDGLRVDTE